MRDFIDLLKTDTYFEYAARPQLLRERWRGQFTVIDEIQKVLPPEGFKGLCLRLSERGNRCGIEREKYSRFR